MSNKAVFTKYLKEISAVALQGDAREESFYQTLAEMLAAIAKETGRVHVRVTTLPKPTDAGNPDFRLWDGTNRIIGYIEAKKPTEDRLDVIEESEQLTRYRSTFLTPEDVHYGRADQIIKERQAVLMAAYEIHPKRFKGKIPQPAALPPAVWINKPALPNSDPALH